MARACCWWGLCWVVPVGMHTVAAWAITPCLRPPYPEVFLAGPVLRLQWGLQQQRSPPVATPNYAYEKRQRELAKKQKKLDRKSTRLNSSHLVISYAVFCL